MQHWDYLEHMPFSSTTLIPPFWIPPGIPWENETYPPPILKRLKQKRNRIDTHQTFGWIFFFSFPGLISSSGSFDSLTSVTRDKSLKIPLTLYWFSVGIFSESISLTAIVLTKSYNKSILHFIWCKRSKALTQVLYLVTRLKDLWTIMFRWCKCRFGFFAWCGCSSKLLLLLLPVSSFFFPFFFFSPLVISAFFKMSANWSISPRLAVLTN